MEISHERKLKRKKILLIDDEPDILEFLSYNFRKKGHEVFTADDGLVGLSSAIENKPDIIILDILMPQMNGIVMCRHLKNDDRLKNIPVVFLSAVQDDYRVLSSMDAGGEHYISKPVRFDYLYNYLIDFFRNGEIEVKAE
ncbi:MAG TPA: response regulator [Bacteroidia bacterium]